MQDYDVIVVGGGLVGIAIAYGLVCSGQRTVVFDEGDNAFRAARGNFGLIWVQGKGDGCAEYARWTMRSAEKWHAFNLQLQASSGINTGYSRPGGFDFCLTQNEFEARANMMSRLFEQSEGAFEYEMLDREAVSNRLVGLGDGVVGASFSQMDGHVNPLHLLRALHVAFKLKGGDLRIEKVLNLACEKSVFKVNTEQGKTSAGKIVLAAGLGNRGLAEKVGLSVPVRPQRGQILVTERLKPFLDYPTSIVRQTEEGTVLLGDSHEEVGFDDGTSLNVMADIADRARSIFPLLAGARLVRAWGALRILTADGLPVYDQSRQYPGAFTASSHSGVTLAAVHAQDFADYVSKGELPAQLKPMSEERFHVH